VAKAGGYAGIPLAEGSKVDAAKELANAAREEIAKIDPRMADANAEYSFWKNVQRVAQATSVRRVGQQGGIKRIAYGVAGGTLGSLAHPGVRTVAGLEAGKVLSAVETNPLRNTLVAVTKNKLANAIDPRSRLATRQPRGGQRLLPSVTAASPVRVGQRTLKRNGSRQTAQRD
jgi:hypothetical protein